MTKYDGYTIVWCVTQGGGADLSPDPQRRYSPAHIWLAATTAAAAADWKTT